MLDKIEHDLTVQESRKNKRPEKTLAYFKVAIELFVLNLLQAHRFSSKTRSVLVSVPLNKNEYGLNNRYTPRNMTYKPFKAAYDGLRNCGYIAVVYDGFNFSNGDAAQTRITATDKLLKLSKPLLDDTQFRFIYRKPEQPEESIILKDGQKKKTPYTDTPFTLRARERLAFINNVLSGHSYGLDLSPAQEKELNSWLARSDQPYVDFAAVQLQRIFNNGSFEQGGRFYGAWWQNFPKALRKCITIDGKSTAELDYSQLHISMMYAELGLPVPEKAYFIHPKVSRAVSKEAVNALISASGIPNPVDGFSEEDAGVSWLEFIDLIKAKHSPLVKADMLLKGYGLKLQCEDAALAESIMLYFAEQDVPCLCLHDGFLIQSDKATALMTIMKDCYRSTFGQSIEVRVK